MSLEIGTEAPDFTLKNQFGEEVTKALHYPAAAVGAAFVVAMGYVLRRRQGHHAA